jgi:hypothetical protein
MLLLVVATACDGGGSSPTAPPTDTLEVWGAVGCSQTRDAIDGYHRVGGSRGWPVEEIRGYGGGALFEWANTANSRWSLFQAALDAHGADAVWLELCVKERSDPSPTRDDLIAAETIALEIRRRAPTAVLYVSALNEYEGIVCQLSGPDGPAVSQGLADHLIALRLARRGPVVGPLDASTTRPDRCHANQQGEDLQGEQLRAFFG